MVYNAMKILWILLSMAVLFITLFSYAKPDGNDSGIFLVYGMLFLSFPSSLLVAGTIAICVILQERLGVSFLDLISNNYLGFTILWALFFSCGYLQWFKFVPWVWRKWVRRKEKGGNS